MQYVNIPVNFLTENRLNQLSVETRLIAYFLTTAPRINRIGLYHLPLSEIVRYTRLDPYYVNVALYNLEQMNFCRYDKVKEYVWISNFASWQDHHGSFELLLKNLPSLSFLNEFYRHYATFCYPSEAGNSTMSIEYFRCTQSMSNKKIQGENP